MSTSANTAVKNTNDPSSRLAILQSGYRSFVGSVRVPIPADTKWLLEIVCSHGAPHQLKHGATIYDQADSYLKSFVWKHQNSLNKQRQDWVKSMKT